MWVTLLLGLFAIYTFLALNYFIFFEHSYYVFLFLYWFIGAFCRRRKLVFYVLGIAKSSSLSFCCCYYWENAVMFIEPHCLFSPEHTFEPHFLASSDVRSGHGIWVGVKYTTSRLGFQPSCLILHILFLIYGQIQKKLMEDSEAVGWWRYQIKGTGFMMSKMLKKQ